MPGARLSSAMGPEGPAAQNSERDQKPRVTHTRPTSSISQVGLGSHWGDSSATDRQRCSPGFTAQETLSASLSAPTQRRIEADRNTPIGSLGGSLTRSAE